MFGFLTAPCSSCHGKNPHGIYRSYFCGVSTRLSLDYGPWARFLVNRDSTFVSLLTAAQAEDSPGTVNRTCCNPFAAKRDLHCADNHSRYAAAVTLCGLWSKLEDDRADESFLRRGLTGVALPALRGSVEKATATLESLAFPVDRVRRELAIQSEIEASAGDCWDAVSQPTAQAFGQIFRHSGAIAERPENASFLEKAGRSLGRIIYMADAIDDREDDARKKRFNPLIAAGSRPHEVREWLGEQVSELQAAARNLTTRRHRDLVDLILVDGVCESVDAVLEESEPGSGDTLPGHRKKSKKRKKRRARKQQKNSCWDGCCVCDGGSWDCGDGVSCCDSFDCCPCDCS